MRKTILSFAVADVVLAMLHKAVNAKKIIDGNTAKFA